MSAKVGRNDPCPCGSGKKFKSCCLKHPKTKKTFKATWLKEKKQSEQPVNVDLLQRTFGQIGTSASDEKFKAPSDEENKEDDKA